MSSVNSYTPKEFSLSQAAINHFSLNLAGKDSKGIRLSVSESTGCSGYSYQIDYVEKEESDDLVFKFEDITVYNDANSCKYLKGTKVDFLVEGGNEGRKFLNPNVKAICGCGESFEVDI